MPELPEVETIVRQLKRRLPGQTIVQVKIYEDKMVQPLTSKTFIAKLKGVKIKEISRRAKVIVITLNNDRFLLVHLKMTGQLIFVPPQGQQIIGGHPQVDGGINLPHRHTRAEFQLQNGSILYFNDLRKFGWLKLVDRPTKETLLSTHGVEPLSKKFTETFFIEQLTKYPNRFLKQSLLDQTLIAGLGNIYVDEACFLAKIRPDRKIKTLTTTEFNRLHQAIIFVLKLSIKKKGTSARNYVTSDGRKGGFVPYLNVYGRNNQPCKKCRTPIKKIKLVGRSTHFCSNCQK